MYGDLIRLDPDGGSPDEALTRFPLDASAADGGMDERSLRDLLFRFPETLPIAAIDAAYQGAIPVCRELWTPAGYVDALYVNPAGRLTLAEFKLWRNPQARREVIGQILDYAKELASWGYEDLQREVSKTMGRAGNVLFELVRARLPDANEAEFVDHVTRHLRRGEFLLLIVGDGIREGVENIVDFVQRHSGLHFNLALVEAAVYRDGASRRIVQPRVVARTEIVRRVVYEDRIGSEAPPLDDTVDDEPLSERQQENLRFWQAVLRDYAFSDVTLEVPAATKGAALFVKVRNSEFGDWGLWFTAFLYHSPPAHIGCYLTCRKGIATAVRLFGEMGESFEELRRDVGGDLDQWTNSAGRPRLGFHREVKFPLVVGGEETDDFHDAVLWMRDCLNRLVSTLHPRLQQRLSAGR